MSRTLVTGATGFTGTALCRQLVNDGEQVVAFVRSRHRSEALERIGVECRFVDICNPREVSDQFGGIERVYHLAAAWRAELSDRDEFRRVNVEATRSLLEASVTAGVRRFVHCSTVGVQGQIDDPPADEDYRFQPGDHYQRTKLEGELLASEYFRRGLCGTVVRPVGIYGPGDTRFLKLFRAIYRRRFVMIGSGQTLYHLTYIDDLVRGLLLAGRRAEAEGEIFTIAGARYTTVRELVDLVATVLDRSKPRLRVPFEPVYALAVVWEKVARSVGIEPVLYPRRVEFFHKDRAFCIKKARSLLGYNPEIELAIGLAKTADWYAKKDLL